MGLRVGEPRYPQNLAKKEIKSQHFPADWKRLGISGAQGSLKKMALVAATGRKGGGSGARSGLSESLKTPPPQSKKFLWLTIPALHPT